MRNMTDDAAERYAPDFPSLVPYLRPLPDLANEPIADFPGSVEGNSFVRRTSVSNPAATRAVYVHGLNGSSLNWTDLMYLLEPIFPGIALDLPGYGFTDPPADGEYSIDLNAQAVIDVITAEGGQPVHLLGNSLGGATAIAVAAKRPDLVKSLILVSPAMLTKARFMAHGLDVLSLLTAARKTKAMGPEKAAREHATQASELIYADPDRIAPARQQANVDEVVRRLTLPYSQDAASASTRDLFEAASAKGDKSLWQLARKVKAPTLVFYGTEDQLVSPKLAPRAAEVFSNGKVSLYPDTGHCMQIEFPEKTAVEILQWLAAQGVS